MKKIAIIMFSIVYLNAQIANIANNHKSLEEIIKNLEKIDKIPNILDLENEDKFFFFNRKEVFEDIQEFIKESSNLNKQSPKYKIYTFYKSFLEKNIDNSPNRTLFNYINLNRINFVYRYFIGEDRDKYYIKALNSIKDEVKESYIYLAKFYISKEDYQKALEYAKLAPQTEEIKDIIEQIESKYIAISLDKVNIPDENILARVDFKNIKKIYLKIYKTDDINNSILEDIEKIGTTEPIKNIEIELPENSYKNSSTEISLGKYDIGEYIFILSYNKKSTKHNYIVGKFLVSNIGILKQNRNILILDRSSGEPIEDAKVIFYEDIDRTNQITSLYSDKNGVVKAPKSIKKYFLDIEYKSHIIKIDDVIYSSDKKSKLKPKNSLFLITDKKQYSIGEKVKFQGITIKSFPDKAPKILPKRKIELGLYEKDNLIKSKIFKSDNFGAFNGYFQIPKDVKADNLILKSNDIQEKINIIDQREKNFKINIKNVDISDKSQITGEILSNSNRPIKIKSLKYYLQKGDNLIKVDNIDIKDSGEFKISIKTPPNDIYRVYIIAKNIKGKKESVGKEINRKYANIKAKLLIDKIINKNSPKYLRVEAKNLDGDDINISGEIVVEKINPIKLSKYRYWKSINQPIFNNIKFGKEFFQYTKREDIEVIKKINFDSSKQNRIELNIKNRGIYRVKLKTKDIYGKEVEFTKKIVIFDRDNNVAPFKTQIWHILDKDRYNIGSTALLTIKSSIPNQFIIFELEKNGDIIREEFLRIDGKTTLKIPIKEEYRGGLNYSITTVKDNRVYTKRGKIDIPWDNSLDIEYLSFNKILKPQTEEKWKFKTVNNIEVQMLASISNRALDLNINRLYQQNIQNYTNLWRAFEFEAQKFKIDRVENMEIEPISQNIVIKLMLSRDKIKAEESLLFKPQIESNRDKELNLNFITPNRVGKWKFSAFIHSKGLKFKIIEKDIEIKKDLIVNSKLPNQFRVGDNLSIYTRVINKSGKDLNITTKLKLIDTKTKDDILDNKLSKNILLKSAETKEVEFKLKIPNINLKKVEYNFIAEDKEYRDIYRKVVPIIKNSDISSKSTLFRIEPEDKKFIIFKPLQDINLSKIEYKKLIFEFTSNLSWEAIMATKPLIDKKAYSNIEIFNRYFVSSIVLNLLKSYKNIDRIDILNLKELSKVQKDSLNRLLEKNINLNSGGWGWFADIKPNLYVTLYILDGIRKLKDIGIKPKIDNKIIDKAVEYIDNIIISRYKSIKNYNVDNLSEEIIYYLYIRSFYNQPLISKNVYRYYMELIKNSWRDKSIYEKTLIALTLNKQLGKSISLEILEDIEKNILIDENLGLYLNIEDKKIITHTAVMELFHELEKNSKSIELMKIWLIEQKGIRDWKSSILTADSIYALLSNSRWILDNIKPIDILFKSKIDYQDNLKKVIKNIKDGVGYYKLEFDKFDRGFSKIQLKNPNDKPIWGHIYLEYITDSSKYKNLPIKVEKSIRNRPFSLGDIVNIEIKIKLDRDIDFLIVEDELPIPFKIIEESSFIDEKGLKYYRVTTDSRVRFYIPKLKKGEYLFEYKTQITHKGKFKGGVTTVNSIFNKETLGYFKSKDIEVK